MTTTISSNIEVNETQENNCPSLNRIRMGETAAVEDMPGMDYQYGIMLMD